MVVEKFGFFFWKIRTTKNKFNEKEFTKAQLPFQLSKGITNRDSFHQTAIFESTLPRFIEMLPEVQDNKNDIDIVDFE